MADTASTTDASGVRGVIFDMDGTLVDSEDMWFRLMRQFYAEHGLDVPLEAMHQLAGAPASQWDETTSGWWSRCPRRSDEELSHDGNELLDAWLDDHFPGYASIMNPGVPETVAELRRRGLKLAVASSSPHADVVDMARSCGIERYLDVVIGGDEVEHPKPDPEPYLRTMALLGIDAPSCVVVEDSDHGIAAARAAGVRVAVKREGRYGFSQEGGTWYIDRIPDLLDIL